MRLALPQIFHRPGGGRSALALTLMGLASFSLGRLLPSGDFAANAQPPSAAPSAASTPTPPPADGDKRVVAYIYGTIPITRAELGEYLIARYGAEKLSLMVNRKIIDHVAAEQHVAVDEGEVDADLDACLKGMNVNRAQFVKQILAEKHLTLYEWKEDVIKPKLLLTKLCRNNIKVVDADLQNEFEATYGEKVQCRAIIFAKADQQKLLGDYGQKLRTSDEEFDRAARSQMLPALALKGGEIKPIARHSENEQVEKVAFSLRPGEVSELIETPQGLLLLKCVQRLPADTTHTLDKEREVLTQAVIEKKLQKEIPTFFQQLRADAKPLEFMKPQETEKDLVESVQKNLKETPPEAGNKLQGH